MKISNDFVLRNVYGKAILMPVRRNNFSGNPVLLNSTAKKILSLAESVSDTDSLYKKSCETFDIQHGTQNAEGIYHFIIALIDNGILEKN